MLRTVTFVDTLAFFSATKCSVRIISPIASGDARQRSSITYSESASEFLAARGLKPKRALIHSTYLSGPRIAGCYHKKPFGQTHDFLGKRDYLGKASTFGRLPTFGGMKLSRSV